MMSSSCCCWEVLPAATSTLAHTRRSNLQAAAGVDRGRARVETQGDSLDRPGLLTFHPRRFEDEDEVRVSEYLLRASATRGGVEEGGKCDVIADAGGGVHMPRL